MCATFPSIRRSFIGYSDRLGSCHGAPLAQRVKESLAFIRLIPSSANWPDFSAGIGMAVAAVGLLIGDAGFAHPLVQPIPPGRRHLSFLSSLNKAGRENWPARGLITGLVLMVVFWRTRRARARLALGRLAGRRHSLVMTVLRTPPTFLISARLETLGRAGLAADPEERRRGARPRSVACAKGWADFAAHVQRARVQHGATILIGSHYSPASMMAYYLPDRPTTYLPKESYGKSQFSLWPGFELSANSRALYVAHSVRPLPKALTNDFPKCELVDDFSRYWAGPWGALGSFFARAETIFLTRRPRLRYSRA